MNILIVRLGALGDIVHTIPAVAALRRAFPDARIDWVVDARHADVVELVTPVDHIIRLDRPTVPAWADLVRRLRPARYDVALDFQGLMKSAVLARASGARRIIGFSIWHLREKTARPFYSEVDSQLQPTHIIQKNLRLLSTVGVKSAAVEFPLARVPSAARDQMKRDAAGRPVALINPGAAWPNKRWPVARYGEVGGFLREVRGMQPYVLWGPEEQELAQKIVDASGHAALLAPSTTTVDLVETSREAALMVSGDTGPLHIAAAVGTPSVAIFGPTDPERNGPWSADDIVVSRHAVCGCHYQRRCRQPAWCLEDVQVAEVTAAIQHRLSSGARARAAPGE
ncbi:MAG: glycosyltransferase family 9 protein [Vicinamibacterales bacterium]